MHDYVALFATQPVMDRLAQVLDRVIPDRALHARFVNTLARMEYVGARKMVKARHSDSLDVDGLQHLIEEAGHALRLKRAALKIANEPQSVATFAPNACLAGEAGENYLQEVDRAAESAVADLAPDVRTEANYRLSSALIEVRAEAFYPLYEDRLRAHEAPFSVAAIQKDEARHLAEMRSSLEASLPDWKTRVDAVCAPEAAAFEAWLCAVEREIADVENPRTAAGTSV